MSYIKTPRIRRSSLSFRSLRRALFGKRKQLPAPCPALDETIDWIDEPCTSSPIDPLFVLLQFSPVALSDISPSMSFSDFSIFEEMNTAFMEDVDEVWGIERLRKKRRTDFKEFF